MKITKSELKQIIKEVTQGEMEFAELEAARQNFIENRRSGEALDDLMFMVEKLVEPLMNEMGLFFEVQELLNHGEIVFTNDRNMEVRINPRGAMGRYDVQVNPLHEAHDSFDPVQISLDSMKGVVQYIKDEFIEELQRGGTYKQPPRGMVGEPEGQMELPLPRENKMRITKSQLQQVIREAIEEERRLSGAAMADREFAQVRSGERLPMPEKAEIEEVLDDVLQDIRKNATSDHIAKQGARAEVLLSMLMGGRFAAEQYKEMFGERGLRGYMDDRYGD